MVTMNVCHSEYRELWMFIIHENICGNRLYNYGVVKGVFFLHHTHFDIIMLRDYSAFSSNCIHIFYVYSIIM